MQNKISTTINKLTFIFGVSVLAIFLLASCKKDKEHGGSGSTASGFRIGSKWVYHNSFFDQNGMVNYEYDETFQVTKDTVINGQAYFEFTPGFYFTNKADGYYEYCRLTNMEQLIYKTAVSKLDTYTGSFMNTSQASSCVTGFNAIVTSIDTSIIYNNESFGNLISFTFNTYALSCQMRPGLQYDLYSKKTGLMVERIIHDGTTPAVLQKINLKSLTY